MLRFIFLLTNTFYEKDFLLWESLISVLLKTFDLEVQINKLHVSLLRETFILAFNHTF